MNGGRDVALIQTLQNYIRQPLLHLRGRAVCSRDVYLPLNTHGNPLILNQNPVSAGCMGHDRPKSNRRVEGGVRSGHVRVRPPSNSFTVVRDL